MPCSNQTEADRLMVILRGLKSDGISCIYISHKLDEVFAIADRITILRDGKNISGFKVNAKGIRRDMHPTSFQKIFLEFILNSEDTEDSDIQKAIQLSEETYCPVWAMLKNNVEVISEYKIIVS